MRNIHLYPYQREFLDNVRTASRIGSPAEWSVRDIQLRRKCQECRHYPPHGSFPAVCSTCRECSKWEEPAP